MLGGTALKIIGFAATGLGIVAGLIGDYAKDKKQSEEIKEAANEAVREALALNENNETEE